MKASELNLLRQPPKAAFFASLEALQWKYLPPDIIYLILIVLN